MSPEAIANLIKQVPIGDDANEFISALDKVLDDVLGKVSEAFVTRSPWDTLEKQLQMCYYNAWGEIRSADTFARQIEKIGFDYPELKLNVARQLHDEMRHFKMYRDCAFKMGGKKDVFETPEAKPLFNMFEHYDSIQDPLEEIICCQFISERGALIFFKEALKFDTHPELRSTVERILPDELFHIAVGRMAARMLAKQGRSAQERILELVTRELEFPAQSIAAGREGQIPFIGF
ncbi:MAG: ferritin-like domain-containing protein [Acidobacteria bacterium]|nr:MAG: ferritin-like domain-containing protein [Acidobacteriota bacterium]